MTYAFFKNLETHFDHFVINKSHCDHSTHMRDNFAPRRRLKMLIKWFSQPGFEWKTKSHKSHDCGHRLLTTTTNCGRWLGVLVFRRFGGCRRRKSGSNYALPKAFAAAMVYISAQIAIGPGFWGFGPWDRVKTILHIAGRW